MSDNIMKVSIGFVVFMLNGEFAPLMGGKRKLLLQKVYRRMSLGEYELYAHTASGNYKITWDDVNWNTASACITGKPPTEYEHPLFCCCEIRNECLNDDKGWRHGKCSIL